MLTALSNYIRAILVTYPVLFMTLLHIEIHPNYGGLNKSQVYLYLVLRDTATDRQKNSLRPFVVLQNLKKKYTLLSTTDSPIRYIYYLLPYFRMIITMI